MKIKYIDKTFRDKSLDIIDKANEIIREYASMGYDLTLRMLYYQMVTKNYIPNTERSYKNFGSLLSDARLAGLVDWNSIVDRTRIHKERSHWDRPEQIIRSAYSSYNIDHWADQEYRPRVWIEKDALIGVISRICNRYDVPYLACRGYMSQSAMWQDSQKAIFEYQKGFKPIIIHLGDHDPSGIDMTRDIDDRMIIFNAQYEIRRIALNMNQVEENNLPKNPAKLSDTRSGDYIEKFGYSSWELDALTPTYINDILGDEIRSLIDWPKWDAMQARLDREKKTLEAITDNYDIIVEFLESEDLI